MFSFLIHPTSANHASKVTAPRLVPTRIDLFLRSKRKGDLSHNAPSVVNCASLERSIPNVRATRWVIAQRQRNSSGYFQEASVCSPVLFCYSARLILHLRILSKEIHPYSSRTSKRVERCPAGLWDPQLCTC